MHQGTLGIRIVGGNEEEVADGSNVGEGLHHDVDVVALAKHVHPHHARKILVPRRDVIERLVLVELVQIRYPQSNQKESPSVNSGSRAALMSSRYGSVIS